MTTVARSALGNVSRDKAVVAVIFAPESGTCSLCMGDHCRNRISPESGTFSARGKAAIVAADFSPSGLRHTPPEEKRPLPLQVSSMKLGYSSPGEERPLPLQDAHTDPELELREPGLEDGS